MAGRGLPELPIIAIGGSAGALTPVLALLKAFPPGFPAIILIAIHKAPGTPSLLPQISKAGPITIHPARDGTALDQPVCLIAPPSRHMVITPQQTMRLVPDGHYRSNNIDLLFNSLARNAGPRTIGVILSGLMRDGVEGLRAIKEAGGIALVQNPTEAQFPDMPEAAIMLDGSIDFIGSTVALAEEIRRRVGVDADVVQLP